MISAENFSWYALKLFATAGHTDATAPAFVDHSAKQFVYFDCNKTLPLNAKQRALLNDFGKVSRLFTVQGIDFFSLEIFSPDRSKTAHDAHQLIQFAADTTATICLAHHHDDILLSFAGFGSACLLSDWYSDEEKFLRRLDIANMTITNAREYFCDFVAMFARRYYFPNEQSTLYEVLPINFFNTNDEIPRAEIEDLLLAKKFSFVKNYGNDFVNYEVTAIDLDDSEQEIALILREAEEVQLEPSDEEAFSEPDEYSFEDIAPEVFEDPELLLEHLKKYDDCPPDFHGDDIW